MGAEQSSPRMRGDSHLPPPHTVPSCPKALKELLEHLFEERYDEAASFITRNPAVCKERCYDGRLPLHLALAGMQPPSRLIIQIVEAYPDAVADQENRWRLCPLHHAAAYGFRSSCGQEITWAMFHFDPEEDTMDLSALEKMLEVCPGAPALRDSSGETPLLAAMGCDHFPHGSGAMVRAMLRACPQAAGLANDGGVVPLMRAVGLHAADEEHVIARELLRLAPESLQASTTGNWNVLTYALRHARRRVASIGGGIEMYAMFGTHDGPNVSSAVWLLGRDPSLALREALETSAPPPRLAGEGVRTRRQERKLEAWRGKAMSGTVTLGPVGAQLLQELRFFVHRRFSGRDDQAGRLLAFSIALQAATDLVEGTGGPGSADWEARVKEARSSLEAFGDGPVAKGIAHECIEVACRYAAARHTGREQMLALLCCLRRGAVACAAPPPRCSSSTTATSSTSTSNKRPRTRSQRGLEPQEPSALIRSLASLHVNLQELVIDRVRADVIPRWRQDLFEELLNVTVFSKAGAAGEQERPPQCMAQFYNDTWQPGAESRQAQTEPAT